MRNIARLILAILRELSDESAYHRYLAAHNVAPSSQEWRNFSEERHRSKYSQAKCC